MVMDERTMLAAHSFGPPVERLNCKEFAGLANERGLYASLLSLVNIYSCKDERNYGVREQILSSKFFEGDQHGFT
jgi:hypothetical protein